MIIYLLKTMNVHQTMIKLHQTVEECVILLKYSNTHLGKIRHSAVISTKHLKVTLPD